MKFKSFAITDIGMKRSVNQDAYLIDEDLKLYVVADGMGGHKGGEVASQLAVSVLRDFFSANTDMSPRDLLDKGINRSCHEIYEESKKSDELTGMGTTMIAVIFKEDKAVIGQVGDSRAYLMNDGGIWQVTEDHSLLNEEIRAGRLSPSDAENFQFKNVITRSVGYESHVAVDIYHRKIKPGDCYLLCTDGLSGLVTISELREEISQHGNEKGLQKLVDMANERGGDDNITALVCEVCED